MHTCVQCTCTRAWKEIHDRPDKPVIWTAAVSSLLALISREYLYIVTCLHTTSMYMHMQLYNVYTCTSKVWITQRKNTLGRLWAYYHNPYMHVYVHTKGDFLQCMYICTSCTSVISITWLTHTCTCTVLAKAAHSRRSPCYPTCWQT